MTLSFYRLLSFALLLLPTDGQAHRRGERGVSQSTEQAILLACAAAVALAIVGVVTALVHNKLATIPG
ncbi:hypothetical protein [Propioniciclava flava]|uniref:Uncharacterized protein n=1 Tax=Propioniciclava flava TaxID=2072026 RepID=A0A4Q2EH08_9ACTN|nr:hypothetical protein [Propioniciclava flava]RXW32691.1 hypothetical protein C1706_05975 [Propioniciclava flava]